MNIIVLVKQVPDASEVKISRETNTLIRDGVPSIINPNDRYAIEEALRLREKHGGKVTAVTMGPPQAVEAMKEAVSLGVDDVVLLSDRAFAGADTWATSYALSQGIRKVGEYDLVIAGKQATDGDTAQVGPETADMPGIPFNGSVTYTGKDIAYQLWKFGLHKKDFLYEIWGRQGNGETLWSTSKKGLPGHAISKHFGGAEQVINVIDVRQSYPQEVVSECPRQMGFEKAADQSKHLAYEVVNLSSQAARALGGEETGAKKVVAMSGRAGTGVKARDFIEMVKQKVTETADHPIDENVASALATAAIRYYLVKFTLESQIIFDFEEALKTTGDTGVYLEYAYARACSILTKVGRALSQRR